MDPEPRTPRGASRSNRRPAVRGIRIRHTVSCSVSEARVLFQIEPEGDARKLNAFVYLEGFCPSDPGSDKILLLKRGEIVAQGRPLLPSGVFVFDRPVLPDLYEVRIRASHRELEGGRVEIW